MPGQSLAVRIGTTVKLGAADENLVALQATSERAWHIVVLGQIMYEDATGSGRFVGFCCETNFIPTPLECDSSKGQGALPPGLLGCVSLKAGWYYTGLSPCRRPGL